MTSLRSIATLLCLVAAVLAGPTRARGQDWPTWRHDANRSAASRDSLEAELHLQWVRELPPPRPAFPSEVRLRFDAGYEPVVLGRTMFVPSMVTDTVTALDVETGEVRWRFFTDGPVRFAPVASDSRVYVTSDDGYLYCLSAGEGKLLWKFRGVPKGREDRKLMGNRRLISLWPARGGAVLADGIITFAAGIWPDDGIFIHALDAVKGKPVWSNTESHRIPEANMDHGVGQVAGLTPQGYLALVGGRLVVPCGAQLAAFLDPKTGKLQDYAMGWGGRVGLPKGSWFAAGAGNYLSASGDLYDMSRPNDEKFRDPNRRNDFKSRLYPGGFTRLLIDPTNQRPLHAVRQPVITRESMIYNHPEKGIVEFDLTDVVLRERKASETPSSRARDKFPDKLKGMLRILWRLDSKLTVHIKAGRRLYLGGAGIVQAVDIPEKGADPVVSWETKIQGTPHRMLAAAGKLFVVTLEGRIYSFGAQAREPLARHMLLKPRHPAKDEWTAHAAEILERTKATEGYALVLGLREGRLVEELLKQSKLHVVAVDRDAATVTRLREKLLRAGWYGTRASVHVGDPLSYPFPPYVASLVVSEYVDARLTRKDPSQARALLHPLRPYGGMACLKAPSGDRDSLVRALSGTKPAGVDIRREGDFVLATRSGALPGAADWSHAGADAANAGGSQDQFLKAPLGLLWFDGSLRWNRMRGSTVVRVAYGRIIIKSDRLHAIDVYTGRTLWEAGLPESGSKSQELVAGKEHVYLPVSDRCFVFQAATGRMIREIATPEGTSGRWSNLRVSTDHLVATVGKHLVCLRLNSGELAWKFECGRSALSTAVGRGKAFCAELTSKRRGEAGGKARLKTRAFDLETGELSWEITGGAAVRYSEVHDLLVTPAGIYRGKDGSLTGDGVPEAQIVGERLISGTTDRFAVYDLITGSRQGNELKWNRRGCTGLRSSPNLVTTRFKANAAYVDIESRKITSLWNIRSGCNNNLFPANGILNVPNVTGGCECNYTPTSKAFAPLSEIERGTGKQ